MSRKKHADNAATVYVYLGPSAYGMQAGSIFKGIKADILKRLAMPLSQEPSIEILIIPYDKVLAVKKKLCEKANIYSVTYAKIKGGITRC